MKRFEIGDNESGQRLDRLISRILPNAGWQQINKLFRKKCFKLNGARITKGHVFVTKGDVLEVFLSDSSYDSLAGEKFRCESTAGDGLKGSGVLSGDFGSFKNLIVYEDDRILAVTKPSGMLTHSAAPNDYSDLTSLARLYLADFSDRFFEPAAVSRLDRGTSGVVVFAKNYQTLKLLAEEMRSGKVDRIYECIVVGRLCGEGVISGRYAKDDASNTARLGDVCVLPLSSEGFVGNISAKDIVMTEYRALRHSADKKYTLVEVKLITGKSHQIRVSLAGIGFPIVGDIKYGSQARSAEKTSRRAPYLHCKRVRCLGRDYMSEDADFAEFLEKKF